MISNPFFLISILISAVLAFFTAAFVIEILMKVLKIKQHRTRSTLRLVPFFALVIDLIFNQYSVTSWINPLSCASCVQKFFLEMFLPELKLYLVQNHISLVNYLGSGNQHSFFSAVFLLLLGVSFVFVVSKLIQTVFLMKAVHRVAKRGGSYTPSMDNPLLTQSLQQNKVHLYLSSEIQAPLTVYPRSIIIPGNALEILSKEEFEAVVAHELEHIKYQDPLSRLAYHLVAAFFWWVPTHSWMKKMEQEQELACDQNVLQYGISRDSMASALFKVARQVKTYQTICYFSTPENFTLVRIRDVLGGRRKQNQILGLNFLGVVLGGGVLVLCMMYF